MSRSSSVAVVCLCVVAASVLLCGATDSDVVQLTSANFEKTVLGSSDYWLVEFYAPWCGHCKNLAPTWEELATKVKQVARIGAVDATQHKDLASKYGIQGFPTIKAFGKNKNEPEDYQQGRDLKSLESYVRQQSKGFSISTAVDAVKYKDMYRFVPGENTKGKAPRFLLVKPPSKGKSGGKAPKWFGTVAGKVRAKYKSSKFATASGDNARRILKRLSIESSKPVVVGFSAHGTFAHVEAQSGKAGASFIKSFLKQPPTDARKVPAFPEPSRPKARTPVKLVQLTPANVDKKCFNARGRMCVVLTGSREDLVSAVARPLAKAFRLDKLVFGYALDDSTLAPILTSSFGVGSSDAAPELVLAVVKTGKRKRFALLDGLKPGLDAEGIIEMASGFLNEVAGGNVRFSKYVVPEFPTPESGAGSNEGTNQEAPGRARNVDEEIEL